MRIDITGLNVDITDDLRSHVERRFEKIGRLVSTLATCDVLLAEERTPSAVDGRRAEANLHLKGVTLNAKAHAGELRTAVNEVVDDLHRQVLKRKDKIKGYKKVGTPTIRTLQEGEHVQGEH